jgi:hypothetical protein
VNIRDLFGDTYKIQLDESAFCPGESKNDPWYYQIPCKYGHIYAYSDRLLAYYCDSGRMREKIHREHPEMEIIQDGDLESVFLFRPDQFEITARYARPRKKRQVTTKERRRLADIGRATKFKSHSTAINDVSAAQNKRNQAEDMVRNKSRTSNLLKGRPF